MSERPLIVHLTYVLDFGGLETLIVEAINKMPVDQYRHAIICLTKFTDFRHRITRPGVEVIALDKQPGLGLGTHATLWRLLRRLRPTILHTYNLACAEYAFTATLAGVPVRVHAEHGRDAADPQGKNRKHQLLRRLLAPFIDCYVAVSDDLQQWLLREVGIARDKVLLIDNGVDTARFAPAPAPAAPSLFGFADDSFVIGTVGRVQDVKNHACLIDAFIALRALLPHQRDRMKLVIVGTGPLLGALERQVAAAGLGDAVLLTGARNDIAQIMQSFSLFAMSSIAEGTPVTLLEAMASGLPVVSTRVGGIPDLVRENHTGALVPSGDPQAMASALAAYVEDPALARHHGAAARALVVGKYSIDAMLAAYTALYARLCKSKTHSKENITPCAE
ncbi:TIGR03088 family PEP-CTERM/XrtA system glycosyltransferase [Massilia sp. CF038]|uniref:TIGR03088 family PEP-CTERM/XrtA system glycosyltransferase n=1 Tax=Massilia sp. CF038 TaxID=1881045 RepID=UPI000917859E|nr:TIGR03088 family PEP-CTERM/XrtA system glycosyltransferase [Massilia sp. CF038]SHH41620.1 sugar transferase, PEP-CTERM/EpsH1 system associated [Massilia sp. CF038]